MAESGRKKSILVPLIGGLLTLIVIVVIGFIMSADFLGRKAIEALASQKLGVQVTLASFEMDVGNKIIEVRGLTIANPAQYDEPVAIKIGLIRVDVDTLSQELIVLDQILIDDAVINIVVTEQDTNMMVLRQNVKNSAEADKKRAVEQKTKSKQSKIIIHDFRLNNARLNPSGKLMGTMLELEPVTLKNITISGIGEKANGVLVADAIAQIMHIVTQVSMETSANKGFLKGMSPEKLKEMKSKLGITSEFIKDTTSGVSRINRNVKKIGRELKSLFGN